MKLAAFLVGIFAVVSAFEDDERFEKLRKCRNSFIGNFIVT